MKADRLDATRQAFLREWAAAAKRRPRAEMIEEAASTANAMAGLLDLAFNQMVASCVRWFGMTHQQATLHVEAYIEQRDRERSRREARALRDMEGI